MSSEIKNSPLQNAGFSFPCFKGLRIWIYEQLAIDKVVKIAASIFSIGLFSPLAILSKVPSVALFASNLIAPQQDVAEKQQRMHVMQMVKSYFLAPYSEGLERDRKIRVIEDVRYCVERANHGLAHSLRQGALARDIFDLLVHYSISDSSGITDWALRKYRLDSQWIDKIEMAACFQRSGRQSECSSASNLELYKKYERQDAVNFRNETEHLSLFSDEFERNIFAEAILWSNPGMLDQEELEDLKYLRRILHAAHLLDLRRIRGFDGKKIQRDVLYELFGGSPPSESLVLNRMLWARSGEYLEATGDRDLVFDRSFQERFFTQSNNPATMVDAVCKIRQEPM